jgi:hypothetical protein
VFCWVADHTGLPGSEAVDAAAKAATLQHNLTFDIAIGSNVCTVVHHAVLLSWQDKWTNT